MPKKRRKENRGLPKRWRFKCGAFRYLVPLGQESQWDNKKEFTLGKTLPEAYKMWAERLAIPDEITSVSELMDRYLLEHTPTKSYKAQQSDELAIRRLRPVFGTMNPADIEPSHAYKYFDLIFKNHGFTSAKHDIGTLRHVLTKAVQWGIITSNPLKGGQLQFKRADYGEHQRDRLVEDWEIAEVLSVKSNYRGVKVAIPYTKFKLMTGLRRGDIFRLRLSNIHDDGIHTQLHKTKYSSGKRLIIEWDESGELRALVDEILRISPRRIGNAPLFTTRSGKAYIDDKGQCNAFDSLWQRFMDKVMVETNVTDRFQERDLRAKVASDSDTLIEASERLGHADTGITQRVYRRKPVRVQPLIRPIKHDSIG